MTNLKFESLLFFYLVCIFIYWPGTAGAINLKTCKTLLRSGVKELRDVRSPSDLANRVQTLVQKPEVKALGQQVFYQLEELRGTVSEHATEVTGTVKSLVFSGSQEREPLDPHSLEASLAFSLDAGLDWESVVQNELSAFQTLIQSPNSKEEQVSAWIRSPAHAAYFYRQLGDFQLRAPALIDYLILNNKYFKEVDRITDDPAQILTYSFEHESRNPLILDWYKKPEMDDQTWHELDPNQKAELLAQDSLHEKRFLPATKVASTASKPPFLGGFSVELSGSLNDALERGVLARNKKPTYEVAHRAFEISRFELLSQIRNIEWLLVSSSGFHVNVAFDLPWDYPHFENFSMWLKQMEDYVYLRGLEDGFFGTDKIRLPDPPSSNLTVKKIKSIVVHGSDELPRTMDEVFFKTHKYFHIGLRTGSHYGHPPKNHKRFVLELRDAASTVRELEDLLSKVAYGLTHRVWEQKPMAHWEVPGVIWLRRAPIDTPITFGSQVSSKLVSEALLKAEPHALVPLESFELAKAYNYQTRQFQELSVNEGQKIQAARYQYKSELEEYLNQLQSTLNRGQPLPPTEDISWQAKQIQSRWAKKVRLSQFYSNF